MSDTLNIKFYSNDLYKEVTIREYLLKLLETLWQEGEGFSGKRPLGNSDWQYVIAEALGEDVDKNIDWHRVDNLMVEAIRALR